jgi:flagellar motility protein MotE (MotC chaperone)
MIRLAREFRLIPLVVAAVGSLLALKTFGLLFDGGYTLGQPRVAMAQAIDEPVPEPESERQPPPKGDIGPTRANDVPPIEPQRSEAPKSEPHDARKSDAHKSDAHKSWAQEMFGYPDYTGSVAAPKKPEPGAEGTPKAEGAPATAVPGVAAKSKAGDGQVCFDPDHPAVSLGERAVLESLNQRRLELEARGRALDVRESLLAAAEKRIEGRLAELKEIEARINASLNKKDEAEAARFKGLVTMYENMKAKDAAKIFDRLDMRILVEVATQISPRRMSDILAQMTPEAAERLTIAIANRSEAPEKARPSGELPKIEGRPSGS